jgi:hypothetical protein
MSNLSGNNEQIKNINDDSQIKISTDNHTELPGFNFNSSDEIQDWMGIKAEIDNLLQNSKTGSELIQKSKEVSDYWNRVRVGMRKRG